MKKLIKKYILPSALPILLVWIFSVCWMISDSAKNAVARQDVPSSSLEYNVESDALTKKLYTLASWKLHDLKNTGHWAHTNSDGVSFQERANTLGVKFAGEILYKGDCNYSHALQMWEKSESHRNILLDTSFTHMVTVMGISGDVCYIVQEYAKERL